MPGKRRACGSDVHSGLRRCAAAWQPRASARRFQLRRTWFAGSRSTDRAPTDAREWARRTLPRE